MTASPSDSGVTMRYELRRTWLRSRTTGLGLGWGLVLAWLVLWTSHGRATEATAEAADPRGATAVVLYNTLVPESLSVAQHYAGRRGVPTNQLIGLSLPSSEVITRADFESRLQRPLVAELTGRGLMEARDEIRPASEDRPGRVVQAVTGAKVRNLVVCYGVPWRVLEDPTRREPETASLPEGLRRNEAAVDAELTVLPLLLAGHPLTGPLINPWWGHTNPAVFQPAAGVFVVGRLDGPTPALAAGLVDRALEAERNGLLGRAYFDIRGLSDPAYLPGDRWISNAWALASGYGFDTHLDRKEATLPVGFPLSHVALYAGWYAADVTGPFTQPLVEFMPGAIAYHLHSFSAGNLRSTNQTWVGPLVARGVTATMGMVAEPYLDGTPEIAMAIGRLLYFGFTWGEAAVASQRYLSWQLTVVGDPLYRPFGMGALDRLKDLALRRQGRVDWSLTTMYNRRREAGGRLEEIIADLAAEPRSKFSPILQEKLGDFEREAGHHARAAEVYRRALKLASPQQRNRLAWNLAEAFQAAGEARDAYRAYASLLKESMAVADPILLYERLYSLAQELKEEREARRWSEELARLRPSQVP